ncbi:replicative DNA helicase [[Mycoplasma] falconis]|uniref:Replicative DNA helicase n=1 Tax=[Mycoplasma] falconis TaxID=92403 RepID=A0A501XCP7_9BACT|nr:replicative DNA helicase [[Mycoplasma] falconis]TPE58064.1 replicative DNA helicase [[Mycoplasma] falconis]
MTNLEQKELVILNNEASLLGLLMSESEAYLQIGDILDARMFHFPVHRTLYKAIADLSQDSKQFDSALLINYLSNNKLIDTIKMYDMQGVDYISHLIENAGFLSEIEKYAKNVIDQYKTDELIKLLNNNLSTIQNKSFIVKDLINNLQLDLLNLDISEVNTSFTKIGQTAQNLYYSIINNERNEIGVGLQFGFPPLDELLLGVNPGDLILLGARPAMGKTAFALNIANNVAKDGKTVLFFSLEMSNMQLVQRLMAIDSMVPISGLRKKELTKEEATRIYWTADHMKDWDMYLNDKATLSISDITTLSKRLASNKKIDLVIIDYLQLISDSSKRSAESRSLELGRISRGLKQLARELHCPVLALAQLSRSVEKREDKTPMMSDLRESGNMENDADAILMLHRNDYYNKKKTYEGSNNADTNNKSGYNNEIDHDQPSLTSVIVAKNRHGSTGTVQLLFDAKCNRFIYENRKENNFNGFSQQPRKE